MKSEKLNLSKHFNSSSVAIAASAFASLLLVGCNVGMAPAGPSPEQAKKNFQALPLDQQIRMINSSPGSPQYKAQLIQQAKARAAKNGSN